jgi:hypothetical protein
MRRCTELTAGPRFPADSQPSGDRMSGPPARSAVPQVDDRCVAAPIFSELRHGAAGVCGWRTRAHAIVVIDGVNGLYRQGWRKEDLQAGTTAHH